MIIEDCEVEIVINKIRLMNKEIKNSKLTMSDSNVLSVALNKLLRDVAAMEILLRVRNGNKYDDMVEYYNTEVSQGYERLGCNYKRVLELYSIAQDKDRESLLMYLE